MSYDYSYVFEEYFDSGTFIFNLIYNVFGSAFSIALYILTALGLYTIARRRGIRKPWLAWIPVVNSWIVGCISDQYRYVVKGQNKSKRKVLLVLNVVQAVLGVAIAVMAVMMVFNAFNGAMHSVSEEQMLESIMVPVMGILLICLPLVGLAVAYCVVYYMAMYDVYTSCAPQNNVLFLVLSIIFRVTEPFFIFFNRNKDEGMPPRRETVHTFIPEEPQYSEPQYTEPRDPWDEPEQP